MFIQFIFAIIFIYSVLVLFGKLRPKRVVSPDNKAVLITGCDSGSGNRLAQRLTQIGFKVYATVLNTNSAGAQELQANADFGHKMIVLQMNVTNDTEVNEVYERVKRDLQSSGYVLWAVVNNAGILTSGELDWGTLDTYHKLFEVNVFGTVRVTRVFLPLIKASKGRITIMTSFCGRFSLNRLGIYNMTKHSLIAFSDTLRRELYNIGVKVLSIEPGYFKTQLSSIDHFITELEYNWNQSSDEVKKSYGDIESEKRYHLKLNDLIPPEDNLDIVVNDMIDSVINFRPKPTYSPNGVSFKIISTILMYSPVSFIDWLFNIIQRQIRGLI